MECPVCGTIVENNRMHEAALALLEMARDILDPIFPGCEEVKTINRYLKIQQGRRKECKNGNSSQTGQSTGDDS